MNDAAGTVCPRDSSFLIHPSSFSWVSPFVVMRLAVERERGRRGVHVEDVISASILFVGIITRAELDPLLVVRHRIDDVAVAQQTELLSVELLDRLRQILDALRPFALSDRWRIFQLPVDAQVVVVVDRFGDTAQVFVELDLFLPAKAKPRDGQRDRGKDRDDRGAHHGLRDREAAAARVIPSGATRSAAQSTHPQRIGGEDPSTRWARSGGHAGEGHYSTLAFPPATADITSAPLPSWNAGFSIDRRASCRQRV